MTDGYESICCGILFAALALVVGVILFLRWLFRPDEEEGVHIESRGIDTRYQARIAGAERRIDPRQDSTTLLRVAVCLDCGYANPSQSTHCARCNRSLQRGEAEPDDS